MRASAMDQRNDIKKKPMRKWKDLIVLRLRNTKSQEKQKKGAKNKKKDGRRTKKEMINKT